MGELARSGLITLAGVIAAACLAIIAQEPPAPATADIPPAEFSARRAAVDLAALSERPHPIGTADHARVRQYILDRMRALGVEPELQETTAVYAPDGAAGRVTNILVRLKGSAGKRAVMLAAHYDSVPSGPGAGDDGSGVAVLLETLRALRAGPPLANDVIILITDGEEVGLLGAAAFTAEHPWAKDVGLVLNFEARGNSGPAIMFESTPGNGKLIEILRKHAPHPRASSLTYAVYQRMPNDTDLTVFRKSGIAGLNFAFIGNIEAYHTRLDTPGNLSAGTFEQQGSYALALARAAGNVDLEKLSGRDSIYFNTFGSHLVAYSEFWAIPLAGGAVVLLLAVAIAGLRGGRVAGGKIAIATFVLPVAVCATVYAALVMISGVRWLHRAVLPAGAVSTSAWYAAAVVALALAIVVALIWIVHRRVSAASLATGVLIWWAVLSVATSLLLPGASYLFVWPTLFVTLGVAPDLLMKPGTLGSMRRELAVLALLLAAILLLAPVGYLLRAAFPLNSLGTTILAAYTTLVLCLLAQPLYRVVATFGWGAPVAAALGVLALLAAGAAFTRYSSTHPQTTSVYYLLDADSGRAYWASRAASANAWTEEILTSKPDIDPLPAFAQSTAGEYLHHPAPVAELGPAAVSVLRDSVVDGRRTLHVRVSAGPDAWEIRVRVIGTEVASAAVNGRPIAAEPDDGPATEWSLRFFNPGVEGFDLTLEVPPAKPFTLRTTNYLLGVPTFAVGSPPPRPANTMPNHEGDLTMIAHAVAFDAAVQSP